MKYLKYLPLISFLYFMQAAYFAFETSSLEKNQLVAQLSTLEMHYKKKIEELKKFDTYLAKIEEEQKKIKILSEQMEELKKQLPSEIADAENLETIMSLAKKINLKDIVLTPNKVEDKGFYLAGRYNLKAKGTYLQFLVLIEKINELPQLLNIFSMNLVLPQKEERGRFKIVDGSLILESFYYNKNYIPQKKAP